MVTKPALGSDRDQWGTVLNAALDDLQGQITSTQALIDRPGIYVPYGWGANWKAARNSGTAVYHAIGSSSTQGYYASSLRQTGWVDLLRNALQAQYGDGGSGFRSSSASTTFATAQGVTAGAITAYTANGNYVVPSGTWAVGGNLFGPGVTYLFTSTVGDSYTTSVRGTIVDIYTVAGSTNTHSAWTYSIDGGAAVAVSDTGTADNVVKTTITGLASGTHQVVVTKAGAGGTFLSLIGIAGRNATGIEVNNLAKYGTRSENYLQSATLSTAWNGGASLPANLITYSHGPNEAAANNTGDLWASYHRRLMVAARDANPDVDFLIVLPHVGNFDTTNFKYQDYAERAFGLAQSFNAALVDMWTLGKNSWNYWNGLGYWSDSAVPGTSGTDLVHPSDAGHQAIYSVLYPIINAQ